MLGNGLDCSENAPWSKGWYGWCGGQVQTPLPNRLGMRRRRCHYFRDGPADKISRGHIGVVRRTHDCGVSGGNRERTPTTGRLSRARSQRLFCRCGCEAQVEL